MTEEHFVVDGKGNRTTVLIDVRRYAEFLKAREELESVRAYEDAKSSGDESLFFSGRRKD